MPPRSSDSKTRSRSPKSAKNKTKKRVKIVSAKNQIREFEIDSAERKMKQSHKKHFPFCFSDNGQPFKFPCKYKNIVFNDAEDMQGFFEEYDIKRASEDTNAKMRKTKTILDLVKKGKYMKKIPPAYRLYDVDSGEIYDMRQLTHGMA